MVGTGTADTKASERGEAVPPPEGWRKAVGKFDGTLKFVKDLSLFSLVAVIAMAFFQYNQWSIEKTLDRAKSDYDLATQTFDELIKDLSKAQNLQEILFFTYKGAAGASPDRASFYLRQSQDTYEEYAAARLGLRTGMDRLVYKTQLYIDWASDLDADKTLGSTRYKFDPISDAKLDLAGFDCAAPMSVPDYKNFGDLKSMKVGDVSLDWRSAKHQLVVFYHCFDELHARLLPVRVWASTDIATGPAPSPAKVEADALSERVQLIMDNQVLRLNGFSMLTMTRIEQIRRLNALPSFLDFYLRNRDRIVINPG